MLLASVITRCFQRSWFVFALVFAWKILLFVTTFQPVPANDSYFYDGAVVNLLNGGGYFNPSLALALPISGTEVFCAYPPAYQAVLYAWMAAFGTSEVAAMALHLILFGAYLWVLWKIFQRLNTPAVWINLTGLFLFVITFHDRPDSVAQLFGAAAVLAWVCARTSRDSKPKGGWDWLAATLVILTLCTSVQLGGVYLCLLWLLTLLAVLTRKEPLPSLPLAATIVVPAALIAFVKFGYPRLWLGFQEHVQQTPSVAGWRLPRLDDCLKVLRTGPGVCGIVVAAVGLWLSNRRKFLDQLASVPGLILLGGTAAATASGLASLIYLTPNFALSIGYLQPLVVGAFLTAYAGDQVVLGPQRVWTVALVALAMLGGVRAAGMSTWGVACTADVSHAQAMQRVRTALDSAPSGGMVAVSAAYLYEAARHRDLRAIHSDWLAPGKHAEHLTNLIIKHRPAKLILTQFDYYRHFAGAVRQLQGQPQLVEVKISDEVKTPVPDASRRWQKVVQHISWSPVIVQLNWH